MAYNTPYYGVAYTFYISLEDATNPGKFKSNPTLATGDVEVSKDDGAFANITTLPTVDPSGSVNVKVELSATEMQADHIVVTLQDQSGNEWYSHRVDIHTVPVVAGEAEAGTLTASSFTTNLALGSNDEINDNYVLFTTGANRGLSRLIEDYTDSNGLIDIDTTNDVAFPNAPSAGDEFVIIGRRV